MRIGLLLFLLLSPLTLLAADATQEQKRLKAVQQEISALTSAMNTSASKQNELEKTLKKLDLDISKTSQRLKELNAQTLQSQKALALLQEQQQTERLALTKQQTELKSQIRAAYLAGHNPLLKIMLTQDNPHTFSRLLGYYAYFNRARTQEIAQLHASIEAIQAREQRINEAFAEQKTLQAEHLTRFNTLRKEQNMRAEVLQTLNQDIKQKGNKIAKLQSDAKALNKIITKLQTKQTASVVAPITHPVTTQGKLPWPVQGVLANRFGSQRSGSQVLWNGIFIKAAEGSPVKAVRSGKVVFADWLRGYGLLLIVDHGNNTMSLYAYNESIHKNVGDWVLPQETIASVGKSGGMPDSGLYFEIRQAGNPIDPLKWIQKQG
jgi:septal ring factor EnvC (AmiA/AmiB activator)